MLVWHRPWVCWLENHTRKKTFILAYCSRGFCVWFIDSIADNAEHHGSRRKQRNKAAPLVVEAERANGWGKICPSKTCPQWPTSSKQALPLNSPSSMSSEVRYPIGELNTPWSYPLKTRPGTSQFFHTALESTSYVNHNHSSTLQRFYFAFLKVHLVLFYVCVHVCAPCV